MLGTELKFLTLDSMYTDVPVFHILKSLFLESNFQLLSRNPVTKVWQVYPQGALRCPIKFNVMCPCSAPRGNTKKIMLFRFQSFD